MLHLKTSFPDKLCRENRCGRVRYFILGNHQSGEIQECPLSGGCFFELTGLPDILEYLR